MFWCGHPACRFRGIRAVVQPIAELNRASEADLRLRSARGWTLRLAASLTGKFACVVPPGPHELSRGHALGPSARRVGVNLPSDCGSPAFARNRARCELAAFRTDIVAATASHSAFR